LLYGKDDCGDLCENNNMEQAKHYFCTHKSRDITRFNALVSKQTWIEIEPGIRIEVHMSSRALEKFHANEERFLSNVKNKVYALYQKISISL